MAPLEVHPDRHIRVAARRRVPLSKMDGGGRAGKADTHSNHDGDQHRQPGPPKRSHRHPQPEGGETRNCVGVIP
jgi:hypothetical protein